MARSRRTSALLVGRCSSELSGHKLQRKLKIHRLRAYPDFPVSRSQQRTHMVLHKENHMQSTEAATLDKNPGKPTCSACPASHFRIAPNVLGCQVKIPTKTGTTIERSQLGLPIPEQTQLGSAGHRASARTALRACLFAASLRLAS
jgi:hypothetical protein